MLSGMFLSRAVILAALVCYLAPIAASAKVYRSLEVKHEFQRQHPCPRSAGASPDRVDALVWALTDLLVEQMSNQGIFDLYRRQAEQLAAKNAPTKREITYAPGSREYAEQQRRLKEGNRQ